MKITVKALSMPFKSKQLNTSATIQTTPPRKRRKVNSKLTPYASMLTPESRKIYGMLRNKISPHVLKEEIRKYLSTADNFNLQEFLRSLLEKENETVDLTVDNEDDDYVPYIKSQIIGKLIETKFNTCPICTKQMYMFTKSNMPAFDVFCSACNTKEEHVCIEGSWLARQNKSYIGKQFGLFFQIKTAIDKSKYFTKTEIRPGSKKYRYEITPGSKKYSEELLTMKPGSDKRKYAPNYICVRLKHNEDNIYKVSQDESYMCLPNFNGDNEISFFKYIEKYFYKKQKAEVKNCIVVSGTPLEQKEIDIDTLLVGGNVHKNKYFKLKKLIETLNYQQTRLRI